MFQSFHGGLALTASWKMGDVKDILLGLVPRAKPATNRKGRSRGSRAKPRRLNRELSSLMGWAQEQEQELTSRVPTQLRSPGQPRPGGRPGDKREWRLQPFRNSARTDRLELRHWERADTEFPDYPFARFNCQIKLPAKYTEKEFRAMKICGGGDGGWTQEDTDHLWYLCRRFDMRWHVIHDRFSATASRSLVDIKARMWVR